MADPQTPQPLDFSSVGGKPVASNGLDFSSVGGKPVSPPTAPQSTENVQLPASTQNLREALSGQQQPGLGDEALTGFVKGAGQTVNTVSGLLNKIPGVGETLAPTAGVEAAKKMETPTSTAQKVGAGAEGVYEFVAADEATKGLGLAEKLGIAQKIAKLAESNPVVAKLIQAGLRTVKTGAIAGTQSLAHGATPEEAAKSAATAAGTGAVLEGAASGIKALAPTVKNIAGEAIPVRASQELKTAESAEEVARAKPLQKFDIQKTQPAAKKAIGAVASDIPTRDVSLGEKPTAPAQNFAERAKQVRAEARPVFKKLDELTKDQDMKFSDWQKQEQSAVRRGDYEAATKAKAEQEKLIEKYSNEFDPTDLKNARANWRQSVALDKAHAALNTKAIVQPTPVQFRPTGTPDPGYIRGKNFSKQILALSKDGTLETAGLTAKHIQALQDLGTLLEKSGGVQEQGGVLASALKAAKVIAGGPMTGGGGYAASAALSKLMTDEAAATKVVALLRSAVGPATAVQATKASSQNSQ